MRQIKEGKPWWVGLIVKCACGWEAELERGDHLSPKWVGHYSQNKVCVKCLSCGVDLYFQSQDKEGTQP